MKNSLKIYSLLKSLVSALSSKYFFENAIIVNRIFYYIRIILTKKLEIDNFFKQEKVFLFNYKDLLLTIDKFCHLIMSLNLYKFLQ